MSADKPSCFIDFLAPLKLSYILCDHVKATNADVTTHDREKEHIQ